MSSWQNNPCMDEVVKEFWAGMAWEDDSLMEDIKMWRVPCISEVAEPERKFFSGVEPEKPKKCCSGSSNYYFL